MLLLACLTAIPAASAEAAVVKYDEPSYVRTVNGANTWWWWSDQAGLDSAVCFTYSVDGGPREIAPDAIPPGPLPGCLSPSTAGAVKAELRGLMTDHRYEYCAEQWTRVLGVWGGSGGLQCETVVIDTVSPVTNLTLTDGRGRTDVTNDPGSLRRVITYTDSTSPPWPDTRICARDDSDCSVSDTFNFSSACSPAVSQLTATFGCALDQSGTPDRRVHQCALTFDSAVEDREPDRLRPPGPDNPTYAAGTGNRSGIVCNDILVDRTRPGVAISASGTSAPAGTPINFTVATEDAGAGVDGPPTWDFGDGSAAVTGKAVRHTFATAGLREITVRQADLGGNVGVGRLRVNIGPPTNAGRARARVSGAARVASPLTARGLERLPGVSGTRTVVLGDGSSIVVPRVLTLAPGRRLRLSLTTGAVGTLEVRLAKGKRTPIAVKVRVTQPGRLGLSLRLPSSVRAGGYRLRLRFTPSGGRRVSADVGLRLRRP